MNEQPHNRPPLSRWVLLIAFLLVGIFVGQRVAQRQEALPVDASNEMSKLELVFRQIQENYVDTVNLGRLVENTLPLLMEELDPHSSYIGAEDMSRANESIEGNFDGIGVSFNMPNDTVVVMNVIANGPSERAGVLPGDRIVTVNDSTIAGREMAQDKVVKLLRGERGTRVHLGIARAGEERPVHITIVRDKIPVKSVDAAYMTAPRTGFIRLTKFSKTAHREFLTAVNQLQSEGMENLILDLRGNAGGLLEQSFRIANEFLEEGTLIVYTEGRARRRENYYATGGGTCRHLRLVLLIDEGSASASEIVAGAIQDNDRGTIVGRRSFGKGLVQEPILFSDHSGLRLTVARYYTPTGRSIQKPYAMNNRREYDNELYERFRHGEMMTSDSSHFTGERYCTPGGKIVYGGGGIMPDVFVPIDTIGENRYYQTVSRRNLIHRYSLTFTDQHRSALHSLHTLSALQQYLGRHRPADLFRQYAARLGIRTTDAEWNACREVIDTQLRALIGRNTPLEENAFFALIEPIDSTVKAAEAVLEER